MAHNNIVLKHSNYPNWQKMEWPSHTIEVINKVYIEYIKSSSAMEEWAHNACFTSIYKIIKIVF